MRYTRRDFLYTASAFALPAAAAWSGLRPAWAQAVSEVELMQPGPLAEETLGAANAPVTIIEYASMTCPHCAQFDVNTFPKLKEKYIDTGKVRFVFREFPLDPLALAAAMLARCAGEGKFFSMIDLLFRTQTQWAVQNPLGPLFQVAKQAGFTEASFNACLDTAKNDQAKKMSADILAVRQRAAEKFGVNSTPTFFINGQRYVGALSIEELDKAIQPHLNG